MHMQDNRYHRKKTTLGQKITARNVLSCQQSLLTVLCTNQLIYQTLPLQCVAKPSLMATWVPSIKIGWNYTILRQIIGWTCIPHTVCISSPWSLSNLQEELPFITWNMSVRKSQFLLGLIGSIFHHLWTKVHQIRYTCAVHMLLLKNSTDKAESK